jgi:hypothetical protein
MNDRTRYNADIDPGEIAPSDAVGGGCLTPGGKEPKAVSAQRSAGAAPERLQT